jgi:acyl-CoA synthetase (NDP forming)
VAARALSRAVTYARWRATPRQTVPAFPDVDPEQARAIVHAFLAGQPDGGWLPEQDVAGLLRLYRIPLAAATARAAAGDDTEVFVGVRDDQMFGPLVVLGVGGGASDALAGHAARLAPLTEADADALIGSVRSAAALPGQRGDPPAADLAALRDVLLRVSRLSDDLPEITELDLNLVIARPDSAVTVDARVRVAPQVSPDPFLRRLR